MDIRQIQEAIEFHPDKMAKQNLFETARFFCDLYCLLPGQAQDLHTHDDSDKIYYALEGRGTVTVGDDRRPLVAGEMVLASAGEPHGIKNESRANLVCLVFMAPHPDSRG